MENNYVLPIEEQGGEVSQHGVHSTMFCGSVVCRLRPLFPLHLTEAPLSSSLRANGLGSRLSHLNRSIRSQGELAGQG